MNYTSRSLKDYIKLGNNPHSLFIIPVTTKCFAATIRFTSPFGFYLSSLLNFRGKFLSSNISNLNIYNPHCLI